MLASAILVSITGIMFSSERFSGPLAGFYSSEYNGLVSAPLTCLYCPRRLLC